MCRDEKFIEGNSKPMKVDSAEVKINDTSVPNASKVLKLESSATKGRLK